MWMAKSVDPDKTPQSESAPNACLLWWTGIKAKKKSQMRCIIPDYYKTANMDLTGFNSRLERLKKQVLYRSIQGQTFSIKQNWENESQYKFQSRILYWLKDWKRLTEHWAADVMETKAESCESIFLLLSLFGGTRHISIYHYENTPIQITENFTTTKWQISDKKFWYFSYFCSKHRLWILVRTASLSTHNLCFWAEIRKIMYTPVNPSFTI